MTISNLQMGLSVSKIVDAAWRMIDPCFSTWFAHEWNLVATAGGGSMAVLSVSASISFFKMRTGLLGVAVVVREEVDAVPVFIFHPQSYTHGIRNRLSRGCASCYVACPNVSSVRTSCHCLVLVKIP